MRLRAETNGSMLFHAGEIDNDLWELEMEEGEDPPWTAEAETSALHLHQCLINASNILVKALHNGRGLNTGAHKVGGFVGLEAMLEGWLDPMVKK